MKKKGKKAKPGNPAPWAEVDWTLRDVDISEIRGVSRERVRQMRAVLGKPPSPKKWQRPASGEIRLTGMDCSEMTPTEAAKAAGVSESYARILLKKLDKPYVKPPDRRHRKYRWEKITQDQWSRLKDKEVSILLGISNPVLVTQWRIRHGILRGGVGSKLAAKKAIGNKIFSK